MAVTGVGDQDTADTLYHNQVATAGFYGNDVSGQWSSETSDSTCFLNKVLVLEQSHKLFWFSECQSSAADWSYKKKKNPKKSNQMLSYVNILSILNEQLHVLLSYIMAEYDTELRGNATFNHLTSLTPTTVGAAPLFLVLPTALPTELTVQNHQALAVFLAHLSATLDLRT